MVLYYASALGYQGPHMLDLEYTEQHLSIEQIRENVINELAYFLEVPPGSITPNMRLGADLNLNEEEIYLIGLSICETFHCDIPDEAINSWGNVEDIVITIANVLGQ